MEEAKLLEPHTPDIVEIETLDDCPLTLSLSRLEPIYLFAFSRAPEDFRKALEEGPELEAVRNALVASGRCNRMEFGAKLLVHPHQHSCVMDAVKAWGGQVKHWHAFVSLSITPLLAEAVLPLSPNLKISLKEASVVTFAPLSV